MLVDTSERIHVGQFVPWIDANFATLASGQGRAIAGLSMGGFGALSYAARHREMFTAVASFSGAVDIEHPLVSSLIQVSPLIARGVPGSIYGLAPFDRAGLRAHNPVALAEGLRGLHVALYTGNGSPGPFDGPDAPRVDVQERVVHATNVTLHERLEALDIAHTYVDYGDGSHNWPYWARDLEHELPELLGVLASATAPADHGGEGHR